MSYTFTFDAARRMIRVEQGHAEDLQSALEGMREVRMHAEFNADYGILCDFRQGDFRGSRLDLFKVSEVIKVFFPGQRIALIFSESVREKSGAFVAIATTTALPIQVFDNIEAGEAWLISEISPPPPSASIEPAGAPNR